MGSALHYELGLALKLKDRLSEPIAELQQAEMLDPSPPDPPYTLGVCGDFSKSATELGRATSLRPDNGEAWALLGSVYQQMEQPALAIAALRQAIKLQPEQLGSQVVIAGILARQLKWQAFSVPVSLIETGTEIDGAVLSAELLEGRTAHQRWRFPIWRGCKTSIDRLAHHQDLVSFYILESLVYPARPPNF